MPFRALIFSLVTALLAGSAWAGAAVPADNPSLTDLGMAQAAEVRDDSTIALADGRVLRLAGVDLPRGPAGENPHAALAELVAPSPLTLKGDGPAFDRYGNLVAQVFNRDGQWVQGELLRQGLARVATTPDHRTMARELLAAERIARTHRLGLWADPKYALRHPDEARRFVDSWQVFEGMVGAAEERHGAVYLELGAADSNGLGVRIPAAIARDIADDSAMLVGRRILVRGWIGKSRGPLIAIDHAEQIELLGRARREARE